MQTNVVLLSFEKSSKAYQALSELKQAAVQGKIGLNTAAVVERNLDGSLKFGDGASDGAAGDAALAGTAIGALVGVLGGPLGVLMLGATGGFLGSLVSLDTVETRTSLLEQMSHAIPPGAVAVLAEVEESDNAAVDAIVQSLGNGLLLRRPVEALLVEIAAAEEAQEAAAKEARKVLREKQKAEWKDKFDNWKEEVGDKVTNLKNDIKARFEKK